MSIPASLSPTRPHQAAPPHPALAADAPVPLPEGGAADLLLRVAIVVGLASVLWVAFATSAFRPFLEAAQDRRWGYLVGRPSVLWAAMGSLLLCLRTALWFRYRPAPPATMADAPRLSVVIPAYNEGAMVAASIDSAAAARYPPGRLEIFVVDDGSRDDTWHHIERAAARHPRLVTALRLPVNQGKRRALAEGFRRATGEVLVTVDSDSVIAPDALLALAGALRDPRVGAAAGRVDVLNRSQGVIPRMLAARFLLSFDFLRAAQSTYGTVYCCPGALTAYRASAVRPLLDEWLGQTFLGVPCTYGEDRAMSNLLLAARFDTVYQRTAVVRTLVPRTYGQLCRMFLRWDRSYIREEVRYARVVWRRPPRALLLSLFETCVTNLRYPVYYGSLFLLASGILAHPRSLVRLAFVIGLFSLLNVLYTLRTERSTALLYGVLYAYFAPVALFWIFPWALLTVRARGWLTR